MTYVSNIFDRVLSSDNSLASFSVEIVTFDGESFFEEVEAASADEAQALAAAAYDNVDYTMVQACYAGY